MFVTALRVAAFGDDPGHWPLPPAVTPHDRWLRAVSAGGQGRYAAAAAELARLRRDVTGGPLASLAHSAQASFVRQLGGHASARRWDGRAAALAAGDDEAAADALLGLAADALGTGRFRTSAALLARARYVLATTPGQERSDSGNISAIPARLALRWHWVAAELAMVSGDGATAVRRAEHAAELAVEHPSARHRVKSDVVLAAALCSVGDVARARIVADRAFADAARFGLVPLRWAAACILVDIGGGSACQQVRDECAALIVRRGGVWFR